MKKPLITQLLIGTLTLGACSWAGQVHGAPMAGVRVRCDTSKHNQPVTMAEKYNSLGTLQSQEIIFWETSEFGREYTPLQRCQQVSQKLNGYVENNPLRPGSFQGLRLTNGPVNRQMVICVLAIGENQCNSSNVLLTLNQKNSRNPGQLIGKLLNVGVGGSSNTIVEDSGEQVIVDLGAWENQVFPDGNNPDSSPGGLPPTPGTPNTREGW